MFPSKEIEMILIESNTLPKTIQVRKIAGVGSLSTTPRNGSLNNSIAPIDSPYPSPISQLKNSSNKLEETPILEASQAVVFKLGEHHCPFQELGCQKIGLQKEIKLHIRDDRLFYLFSVYFLREFHSILMAMRLKRMGQWTQVEYKRLADHMSQYWVGMDRALMTVRKYGPQYCFKIVDISKEMYKSFKNKNGNNLIYSDIFETHRFGYRMIAILEPFGDGEARKKYISVYVALIKGDFDPILEWPFDLPVTFALRKPGTQLTFAKTFYLPSNANQEMFQRPISGRNRAFGFQYYFPIAELDKFSTIDDIYIDIAIDVTKLGGKPKKTFVEEY